MTTRHAWPFFLAAAGALLVLGLLSCQYPAPAYLSALDAQATLAVYAAQQTAMAEMGYGALVAQQATATAQAWQTTATVQAAQTTATAVAAQATATVAAITFAQQATATAAAWQVEATATADAARALATAQAAAAERERLAAERERLIYPLRAYGPWVLLLLLSGVLLGGLWRLLRVAELRLRALPRDARGDAPLFVLQQGHQTVLVDPDRQWGPALVVDAGSVQQPALAPPEVQERVTARDQLLDALHRGLPGGGRQRPPRPGLPQVARAMQPGPVVNGTFRVLPPEQVRPWLNEVTPQALTAAIAEEKDEG